MKDQHTDNKTRRVRVTQLLVALSLAALFSAFAAAVAPSQASAATAGPNRCIADWSASAGQARLAHWGPSGATGYVVRQNGREIESGNIAASAPRGKWFATLNGQPTNPGRYHYSIAYISRNGTSPFTYCGSIVVPDYSFPTPACSLSKAGGQVQFNLSGQELRFQQPTFFRGDYVLFRVNGQEVGSSGALVSNPTVDRVGSASVQHASYRYWDADRNRVSEWRYCGSVTF